MKSILTLLQCVSGLHCGIGQGLSDIDAPTARDPVTGHPIIPGTSLKGVLRDEFSTAARDNELRDKFVAAFGHDTKEQPGGVESASAAAFGDLRLLCLPVRSFFGSFAWVTSPGILQHFARDTKKAGLTPPASSPAPAGAPEYGCVHAADSVLPLPLSAAPKVVLEDLDLCVDVQQGKSADAWADLIATSLWPADTAAVAGFRKRFLIVHDDILDFLCETALPVVARNRIGENGVVERGALWYEEHVPSESIFWGLVHVAEVRGRRQFTATALSSYLTQAPLFIQIGGNASTGKGFASLAFTS